MNSHALLKCTKNVCENREIVLFRANANSSHANVFKAYANIYSRFFLDQDYVTGLDF